MIIVDGMPGAGKTTALEHLRRTQPRPVVIFPELQPPTTTVGDGDVAESLLRAVAGRRAVARRLRKLDGVRVIAADRGHIGVLAYRHALAVIKRAPHRDYTHALDQCRRLDLLSPHPDEHVLIFTTDPRTSAIRRRVSRHDPRYGQWYDVAFLTAYHDFLATIDQRLPSTAPHTVIDTTTLTRTEVTAVLQRLEVAGPDVTELVDHR